MAMARTDLMNSIGNGLSSGSVLRLYNSDVVTKLSVRRKQNATKKITPITGLSASLTFSMALLVVALEYAVLGD